MAGAMNERTLFHWRPLGSLVLFPSVRRRGMIQRTAGAAAAAKNPEKTIRATLERARASHIRKGFPSSEIERDLLELEAAIRSQVNSILARHGVAR